MSDISAALETVKEFRVVVAGYSFGSESNLPAFDAALSTIEQHIDHITEGIPYESWEEMKETVIRLRAERDEALAHGLKLAAELEQAMANWERAGSRAEAAEYSLDEAVAALERASLVASTLFASTRALRMDTTEDEALREELLDLSRRAMPTIDALADELGNEGRAALSRLSAPSTEEPAEVVEYVCADPRHAARLSTPKEPEGTP